jgi:hypothetical protein
MTLRSATLGTCDVVVRISDVSAVDSYLYSGYAEDGRALTDAELDELQREFEAEIQMYAWESGLTSNKN